LLSAVMMFCGFFIFTATFLRMSDKMTHWGKVMSYELWIMSYEWRQGLFVFLCVTPFTSVFLCVTKRTDTE
jgi:hypothetical protein